MKQIKECLKHDYNLAVEGYNTGDYTIFFRNFRPSVEWLSQLMVFDIIQDDNTARALIEGKATFDYKSDDVFSVSFESPRKRPDSGKVIGLIPMSYSSKNLNQTDSDFKYKKDIKRRLDGYCQMLSLFYGIASEIGNHANHSLMSIQKQANMCVASIEAIFDWLKSYNIISAGLVEFLDSFDKFSCDPQSTVHKTPENNAMEAMAVIHEVAEEGNPHDLTKESKGKEHEKDLEEPQTNNDVEKNEGGDVENVQFKGTSVCLPDWLDNLIFKELAASYSPKNTDLIVLNWDKQQILSYLGTYFPRSFAEAYCIFTQFLKSHKAEYLNKSELSIYDFGSGTGGELIGFILAVSEQLPNVKIFKISALDGNSYALKILECILDKLSAVIGVEISRKINPNRIVDFDDLNILSRTITQKFDFIITFKTICEFVSMQQFDSENPYKCFLDIFLPHTNADGVLCIADITSFNEITREWLPKMLDAASMACNVEVVGKNTGYNEEYHISHSEKKDDLSKIAWRMYKNKI